MLRVRLPASKICLFKKYYFSHNGPRVHKWIMETRLRERATLESKSMSIFSWKKFLHPQKQIARQGGRITTSNFKGATNVIHTKFIDVYFSLKSNRNPPTNLKTFCTATQYLLNTNIFLSKDREKN